MEVQTFRAATLQEALQQVRLTLGPDAAVLATRNRRQSRMGLFAKTMVEVEATVDSSISSRYRSSAETDTETDLAQPGLQATHGEQASGDSISLSAAARAAQATGAATGWGSQPRIRPQSPPGPLPSPTARPTPAMLQVLGELLEAGVEPNLAKDLLTHAAQADGGAGQDDPWQLQSKIHQRVAASLRTSGPLRLVPDEQRVVAVVGPTGVGKTTTLAKVAAGFRFEAACQIGLITLDTFRLGAVDQLLQYAELISAPLEVVSSPEQVTGALQRLRECDLVMLDTAGRSPKDAEQLSVLAEFLQAAEPHSIQLVVSAISSRAHISDTIEKFSTLRPTDLLITKLDEAVAFGDWLSVLSDCPLPVSYLTAGQHVPQDIAPASPRHLANLLLGHSHHPHSTPETLS